jgi:bifunctional UDP-N-acetylglucosamine pyrophosphorylase/glucosamine-1-phosphate N-acetyltransferase
LEGDIQGVKIMNAVILCAGRGSRLHPLTATIPKALVKVNGKPIIQWEIEMLDRLGIDNIFIVSGYREGVLKNYFKFNIDRPVKFIHQKEQTGTADAIELVKEHIDGDFLVLAGDTIFLDEDVSKLMKVKNAILLTEQQERLEEFGTTEMINDGIIHIHEKSTTPVSNLVNCSAYHFKKNVFDYIPKTQVDERFGERIITNTINLMIDDGIRFKGIKIEKLLEISYPADIDKVQDELDRRGLE